MMDRNAFEQKARTWRQQAYKVSRCCGAGNEEAEDIAQDVMLRLWQMRDELEHYHSLEALITIITRHLFVNGRRRKKTDTIEGASVIDFGTSPQEQLEIKEDEKWLEIKLQRLPTTQRTLLYMRQVERRSHEEIAQLLGIETTSVSTLLARARRTLLEEIKRRNQI